MCRMKYKNILFVLLLFYSTCAFSQYTITNVIHDFNITDES